MQEQTHHSSYDPISLFGFDEAISFLQKNGVNGLCEGLVPEAFKDNPKAQVAWQEFRGVVLDWQNEQYQEASKEKQKMWTKRREMSGHLTLFGGLVSLSSWCGLLMTETPLLLGLIGFLCLLGTSVATVGTYFDLSKTSLQNTKENPFLRARSLATVLLGLETSEQPHQKEVYALLQQLYYDNKLNAYFWEEIEKTHNKYLTSLKKDIASFSGKDNNPNDKDDHILVVDNNLGKHFHF